MAEYDHDDGLDDNVTINSDAIQDDMAALVRNKLLHEEWSPAKVDGWVEEITAGALKELADLSKPFKYAVHCLIMQRTGAALSTGFISLWDNTKDGMVHVPFENDTLHALLTVYFMKLD